MTRAPWSAAWRAYSSCALIIDSLSPVHVVCTRAARIVVIVLLFVASRAPLRAGCDATLRDHRSVPTGSDLSTLRRGMAAIFRTIRAPGVGRLLAVFGAFRAAEFGVWISMTTVAFGFGGVREATAVLVAQLLPAAFF